MTKNAPDLTALLPLAAEIDAVFTPVRRCHPDGGHRSFELRAEFRQSGGLPYRVGGSVAERKTAERQTDEWEAAGLVQCVRSRGRRTHWRLSDVADWAMRSFAGDWSAPWQALHVAMLCIDANTGRTHNTGNFVPEVALIGLDDWKPGLLDVRFYELESLVMPGLVRGLVLSGCDGYGRVGYALTDAGRTWLESPPDPPDFGGVPTYSSEASRQHFEAFMAAIARLDREPPRSSACYIPLSAGLWPGSKPVGPGIFAQSGKVRTLKSFLQLSRIKRKP